MTNAARQSLYNKTKDGVVTSIYGGQIKSSIKCSIKKVSYSRNELKEWLFDQKFFHKLYDLWVISGYDRWQKPSINRIDDYDGYNMKNIELMTWQENKDKASSDRLNGINNKCSFRIGRYTKKMKCLTVYHSIEEAARQTKIDPGNIAKAVSGKRKTAGGYIWERI